MIKRRTTVVERTFELPNPNRKPLANPKPKQEVHQQARSLALPRRQFQRDQRPLVANRRRESLKMTRLILQKSRRRLTSLQITRSSVRVECPHSCHFNLLCYQMLL